MPNEEGRKSDAYKTAEEFLLKECHKFLLFRDLLKVMPEILLPKVPRECAVEVGTLAMFWESTKKALGQKV